MAKNNGYYKQFINNSNQRKFKKETDNLTPAVYATIALALHWYHGWGHKRIKRIFDESQAIWQANAGTITDLLIYCENELNIEVLTDEQYKRALRNGDVRERDKK